MEAADKIRFSANIQGTKRERAEAEARAKAEAEIWEKAENTRKARVANAMAEDETVERARAWTESNAKKKAEITRVNDEDIERARTETESRVSEKTNAVHRAVAETASKI